MPGQRLSSDEGKCWPEVAGAQRAPSRASAMACSRASPSEWPSSPAVVGDLHARPGRGDDRPRAGGRRSPARSAGRSPRALPRPPPRSDIDVSAVSGSRRMRDPQVPGLRPALLRASSPQRAPRARRRRSRGPPRPRRPTRGPPPTRGLRGGSPCGCPGRPVTRSSADSRRPRPPRTRLIVSEAGNGQQRGPEASRRSSSEDAASERLSAPREAASPRRGTAFDPCRSAGSASERRTAHRAPDDPLRTAGDRRAGASRA